MEILAGFPVSYGLQRPLLQLTSFLGSYHSRKFSFSDDYNAAFKKPTAQSSEVKPASFATDGSRVNYPIELCSLTNLQKDPWWRVDLEKEVLVRDVYIYVYINSGVDYLLQIRVGNHDDPNLEKNSLCGGSFRFKKEHWRRIRCPWPLLGRYVSITRIDGNGNLKLCEVEVREDGELH